MGLGYISTTLGMSGISDATHLDRWQWGWNFARSELSIRVRMFQLPGVHSEDVMGLTSIWMYSVY